MNRYPRLVINAEAIEHNTRLVQKLCRDNGITLSVVTKGFSSMPKLASSVSKINPIFSDSRIETIKKMRDAGINGHITLIRSPMMSEAEDVINNCNMSFHVDRDVLKHFDEVAERLSKKHDVLLMCDVGDLREGPFYDEEVMELAEYIENDLPNLNLAGLGTEFACYGSIRPTPKNLGVLCDRATAIEEKIGRKLKYISGGGTSSLALVVQGNMPEKINHLRVGEGINIGREMGEIWNAPLEGIRHDVFTLEAEVTETRKKPTYPIGEFAVDAFGQEPEYVDRGDRTRAIVALGKKDVFDPHQLIPTVEGIDFLGGSSDITIIDIEDCKEEIKAGDILRFGLRYPTMLFSSVTDVYKVYE